MKMHSIPVMDFMKINSNRIGPEVYYGENNNNNNNNNPFYPRNRNRNSNSNNNNTRSSVATNNTMYVGSRRANEEGNMFPGNNRVEGNRRRRKNRKTRRS